MLKNKKLTTLIICIFSILAISFSALFIISAKENDADSTTDKLEIFFFPLNPDKGDYNGDCCIIKIGDTEILVDGGDEKNSTDEIIKKMKSLVSSDNKWDYIIVTHPDSDHIGGFSKDNGIFSLFKQSETDLKKEDKWTLGTFIDFDVSQDKTVKLLHNDTDVTSQITKTNNTYVTGRSNLIKYSDAKYYTSSQCCWEARGQDKSTANGASNKFNLENGATLHILYNYFYDHRHSETAKVAGIDRNNLSVCFLIEYGEHSFLFTGDLMEYNSASNYSKVGGETKLIENNKELFDRVMAKGNGNITFYKSAHHGSITSSSESFIDYIRPEYVVIPVIAGTLQHTDTEDHIFPATQVCDRIFKYTDKTYMPEYLKIERDNDGNIISQEAMPYHGSIHIVSDGGAVQVTTDNFKNTPIQNTTWYKENRNATLYTYTFILPEGTNGVGDCTLIKYGSIDILIDCGVYSLDAHTINTINFVNDIKKYCIDGEIDYLIVSHAQTDAIAQLIGQYNSSGPLNNGIFGEFKILNLYDFTSSDYDYTSPQPQGYANTNIFSTQGDGGWLSRYYDQRKELNLVSHNKNIGEQITITNNFYMTVLNCEQKTCTDENNYSLVTVFQFFGKKLLFMGDLTNEEGDEQRLVEKHKALLSDVTYFQPAYGGYKYSSSTYLLEVVRPEYTVLTSPLSSNIGGNLLPSVASPSNNEIEIVGIQASTLSRLINYTKISKIATTVTDKVTGEKVEKEKEVIKIYATAEGDNIPICGNITFSITVKNNEVTKTSLTGEKSTILLTETNWYKKNK